MDRTLLAVALTAAVTFAPARQSPVAELQIAVEDAADPWSRADGTGFANDVVRAAFKAMDVEVKLVVVPYARCKNMVVEGSVVACFTMSPSPDLESKVLFPSTPLFVCSSELVYHPDRPLTTAKLSNLPRGSIVGTVLGYEYPADVQAAQRSGAIVLDEAPSEAILIRKLAARRISAAIVNVNESKPLEYVAALAGITAKLPSIGNVGTLNSYIGFSARHQRGVWARDAFDAGMRRITANGALKRVVQQWSDSSRAAVHAITARTTR